MAGLLAASQLVGPAQAASESDDKFEEAMFSRIRLACFMYRMNYATLIASVLLQRWAVSYPSMTRETPTSWFTPSDGRWGRRPSTSRTEVLPKHVRCQNCERLQTLQWGA